MDHCKIAIVVLAMAIFTHPLCIGLGVAQNAPTQTAQTVHAPYAQQYESHFTIHTDHSATEVFTQRIKILTQSAIQSVSQQKLLFVEGMHTLNTVEAFTEKPDGRRLPIDPKNILTQDASPGLPMTYFRDLKQRTIIFPGVEVDDTLVMTHKKEIQKRAKQFIAHEVFPRSLAFTSIKITVEAPAAIDLRVKATGKGVVESVADTGGVRRHTIAITPDSYTPEESGAVSPLDRDPAILISTYKSYEELASAYGKTALPRAAVTPDIAALAKEITKNISDRKAQAIAIDAWMKRNIRYVAIFLSVGRVIPNDAATVLKNKFGDCKDKTTLMSALLAAKGIASELVLINLGNAYTLPEPPTFAALNHAILYLPDFDLYDDPTANWAAFGVLAFEAYDKPVVRVSAGGATLAHTPAMKPDDHAAYARTTINVAADGTVTGRTEESNTGALGIALRLAGAAVQTLGDEVAARRQLQSFNTPGTGHFELGNITETMDPVTIKSSFALNERFKPPPAGARAAIPHGMALTARPGNSLLGSRLNGRKAAFVCYAGRQTEDIEATFDQALPMPVPFVPVTIDNATFSYRSTMNTEGRTLKMHREFVAHVQRQVCPPELESQITADLNAVRVNVNSTYAFNSPAQPATRYPPKPPQTIELTRVAAVGQKLLVEFLYSIQPDCTSIGLATVRILEAPQHGKLTVENGQGFTNFPKENQRYECNTRKSDGVTVYYEPDAGFTGNDTATVDVIFASGTSSKRHYSIEVK